MLPQSFRYIAAVAIFIDFLLRCFADAAMPRFSPLFSDAAAFSPCHTLPSLFRHSRCHICPPLRYHYFFSLLPYALDYAMLLIRHYLYFAFLSPPLAPSSLFAAFVYYCAIATLLIIFH